MTTELDMALTENSPKYICAQLKKTPMFESLYSVERDGKTVHKRAMYTYLEENKETILCAIQDVSETYEQEEKQKEELSRALQEAEDASRSKTEFFARMSHDMRTPMNGILGIAELSEQEADINVLQKNIAQIKESGAYLLSLINDTLDFQRIESGKMILNNQIVYTQTVFGSLVDMIQLSAKEKGVDFQVINHNAQMDWYVSIDPVRIKQIFLNLLSNAVKFTPKGGSIILDIQNIGRDDMISHNCIKVIDSGIGMSEDFMRNHLFKPFSQEISTVSSQYAGSGLGLSIAKSLVEMMGGHIEAESELGAGTTFSVYLDFVRVTEKEAKIATEKEQNARFILSEELVGKHILLVEDHPLNAQIAKKILENAHCIVTWAENGQEGVTLFDQSEINEYDAILMDIRMPVLNGLEAAAAIRALKRKDAKKIPIIAMTANAYDEDVQKSLAAGMNSHLAKPIESAKLYETLVSLINK